MGDEKSFVDESDKGSQNRGGYSGIFFVRFMSRN